MVKEDAPRFCCFCVFENINLWNKLFRNERRGGKMKIKKVFVVLVVMVLVLCSAALADKLTIVTGAGTVYTVNEYDLSSGPGGNAFSEYDYGKEIASAAGDPSSGKIVIGFTDGTAAIADCNSLGTIINSGTVGDGSSIIGTAIRPNGDLYFTSASGWAYARSGTDVTAAPAGYMPPADLQFDLHYPDPNDANIPPLFVTVSPLDEVIFVGYDSAQTWIRQGNDMSSVPPGYVNDHMYWDGAVTAWLTLSTGDVVLSQMGPTSSSGDRVFVRDNEDMSVAPAGYIGDGTTVGSGARSKALARTADAIRDDILVIGDDTGRVYLRYVNNLTAEPIPGNSSTSGFAYGPCAIAVTSNNNVVIGIPDGQVIVRSVSNIDGDDITLTANYTVGVVPIIAIIPIPCEDEGCKADCDQIISQGSGKTGDLNTDCYVGFGDFAMFAQNWTKCNDPNNLDCECNDPNNLDCIWW